jgi:outer membrane protein OmpA-like peptidoglycan-associated protein
MLGPRHAIRGKALAAIVVLAAGSPVLAACTDPPQPCPIVPKAGLAVAVGGRANAPAPIVPDGVGALIDKAVTDGTGIDVIRVDGHPSIACAMSFKSDAANPVALADDMNRFKQQARGAVVATRAKEPEANPLQALILAASAAGPGGTVALVDSGLQTVAPLDFHVRGLLDADPNDVVKQLSSNGYLPDLRGRTVVLAGIGYTAPPQSPLDDRRRANLVHIWENIVSAAGATVQTVTSPNTAAAPRNVPAVGPVDVPPTDVIRIGCNTESVLSNDGAVGFLPDSTTFVDIGLARQTLAEFATFLTQNRDAQAGLVGTVAHYGTDDGDAGLSRQRAQRVRDVLIELGADGDRVVAHGAGWGPFPTKAGPPSPTDDPRNRRVVVTITCT